VRGFLHQMSKGAFSLHGFSTVQIYILLNSCFLCFLLVETTFLIWIFRNLIWVKKLFAREGLKFYLGVWRITQIVVFPLLVFLDVTSDILFLVEMFHHGHDGAGYLFIGFLCFIIFHMVVSSFFTFLKSTSGYPICETVAQFLGIRVFYEVYQSLKIGRSTQMLREIHLEEALLESCPQLILQFHYLVRFVNRDPLKWSTITHISLISSTFALTQLINHTDVYGITAKRIKQGGTKSYIFWYFILCTWRFSEITIRVTTVSFYTAYVFPGRWVSFYGFLQFWIFFYLKYSDRVYGNKPLEALTQWQRFIRSFIDGFSIFDPFDLVTKQKSNYVKRKSVIPIIRQDLNQHLLLVEQPQHPSYSSQWSDGESPQENSLSDETTPRGVLHDPERYELLERYENVINLMQKSLLNMLAFDLNNRGANRVINFYKWLELLVGSGFLYLYLFKDPELLYLFLVTPCAIYALCFLLLIFFGSIDTKTYFNAIDEDVEALFAAHQINLICRLIERRHIKKLTKTQNDVIDALLPAQMLAEQNFTVRELQKLGYRAKEIIPYYSLSKLRRAGYNIEVLYDHRPIPPKLHELLEAGYDMEEIHRMGYVLQNRLRWTVADMVNQGGFSIDAIVSKDMQCYNLAESTMSDQGEENYDDLTLEFDRTYLSLQPAGRRFMNIETSTSQSHDPKIIRTIATHSNTL